MANPVPGEQQRPLPHLRLDLEVKAIREVLRPALLANRVTIAERITITPPELQRAFLDECPQIVHFCGHGTGEQGLVLEDADRQPWLVETAALVELSRIYANQIQCLVLNACLSDVQASAIGAHIPYVIGMNESIHDNAAIEFATAFYDALGRGRSIRFAYDLGRNALQLQGIPGHLIPVLYDAVGRAGEAVLIPDRPTPEPESGKLADKIGVVIQSGGTGSIDTINL